LFGEEQRHEERMREGPTHDPLKAQLRSDSGRSSKVIKDPEGIEALVEVPGAGELVLRVDSAGGFSLRGRPEGDEAKEAKAEEDEQAARSDLVAVGVMRADGIVVVRPEGGPTPPSTS
jgi:hypothetical protein